MRGLRPTAALVAGGLLLAGCAEGTGGPSGGAGDEEGETGGSAFSADASMEGELSIMGFGLDDEIAEVRFDLAEQAVDGVEVSLAEGGLDMQQFLSSVASGDVPSLIRADRTQIGTLASRGAIQPLDDCLEAEGVDPGQFLEPALAQVTFADQVYGIPEFNQVRLTMANEQLLEEAGLTLEDVNGSDWEAVTNANQKLFQGSGSRVEVIGYDSKLPEFLPMWARANGGAMLSEDGRTAQLDDPAVVEALEWAVGIYDDQGGFGQVKAFRDSADFFGAGNQFASGTLGAMPMEHWYVNVLNEVSPDAPVIFDTVRDRQGEPISYATGSAWAIPAGSDNPAAACRFAATMVATDSWFAAAEERVAAREEAGLQFTGLLTGNQEADQRIQEELVEPSGEENWDSAVEAIYEANENTFTLPANPADAEFDRAWKDAVNRVLNGQQQPAEALADAQEQAQQALDRAWEEWDATQGQ
ncbi:ABC transporter substrate-binding protein [Ornithinicoccus halotolerans]|uniref:ABC transporter substrate-binding protein n=1 Tax=Ornithinicoccus halotolerans TaxID=1748220 RepID=UPI001296611A|nr:extracellular solute-binding protein [Ornithinicoccus halotolerans]